MNKSIRIILIVLLAGVFLLAGVKLLSVLREYKTAEDLYAKEREEVFHVEEGKSSSSGEEREENVEPSPGAAAGTEEYFPNVTVDFDALLAVNPDVAGWLWLPDTEVSYPLMRGEDNNAYLHTTYNGVYNSSGSIFMDYRNSAGLTDLNTIIYGHNMKNGAMFGGLKEFGEQDYFDQHPYAYIFTAEGTYKYALFSAYVTQYDSRSYTFEFQEGELEDYIAYALENSTVESGYVPTGEDQMILLSTCTSRTRTERFVVHGLLIGFQEKGGE